MSEARQVVLKANEPSVGDARSGARFELWKPSRSHIVPPAVSPTIYSVWWLFHRLGIFANPDYSVLIGRLDDRIVHTMGIFPGYFRFPFMAREDLQLGHLWTDPAYRGRGLATDAIRSAMDLKRTQARTFWYLADVANQPSIRAAKHAGFREAGVAIRTRRWGIRLLGAYVMFEDS